jgi:glycolate oxidase FAD binding subunit
MLAGAQDAVTERVARLRDILRPRARAAAAPPSWWGRDVAADDGTVLRIAYPPGILPAVLRAVDEAAAEAGGLSPAVRGSAGVGVLEAGLAAGTPPAAAAAFIATLRRRLATPPAWGDVPAASVTLLRAPAQVRARADPWGPVPALTVMRAVKDRFDPGQVMSPGRFVGGI